MTAPDNETLPFSPAVNECSGGQGCRLFYFIPPPPRYFLSLLICLINFFFFFGFSLPLLPSLPFPCLPSCFCSYLCLSRWCSENVIRCLDAG